MDERRELVSHDFYGQWGSEKVIALLTKCSRLTAAILKKKAGLFASLSRLLHMNTSVQVPAGLLCEIPLICRHDAAKLKPVLNKCECGDHITGVGT